MVDQEVSIPTLSGAEKAGVLLLTLGEDVAAEILQHLSPKEVQLVGSTMATMQDISRPMVESVIDSFFDTLESQTALGIGNDDLFFFLFRARCLGRDGVGEQVV